MKDRCGQRGVSLAAALFLTLALLAGCGKQQAFSTGVFVGKWQSSRLSMPIYLDEHGGWEIRTEEGSTLQYGAWMYKDRDRTIEWVFKNPSGITRDVNPVLSATPDEFVLRERNGSVTTFRRIR